MVVSNGTNIKTRIADKVLDAREFRFVELYVCGGPRERENAYRSALVAGYSHSTSETWSSTWVRPEESGGTKPHVFEAIQQRRAEIRARTAWTKDRFIEEVTNLAKGNAASFVKITPSGDPYIDMSAMTYDEMAAVAETTVEEYTDGRGEDAREIKRVKVKQHDKKGALDLLAKVNGWLAPTKLQHGNDPDNPLNIGVQYDLSKLTENEVIALVTLLQKATVVKEKPSDA